MRSSHSHSQQRVVVVAYEDVHDALLRRGGLAQLALPLAQRVWAAGSLQALDVVRHGRQQSLAAHIPRHRHLHHPTHRAPAYTDKTGSPGTPTGRYGRPARTTQLRVVM